MATLAGNTIASTYPLLLKIDSNGIDGTLRAIQDGDATDSAVKISTKAVSVTGTLTSDTQNTPETILTLGATYASTGTDGVVGSGSRLEFQIPDDDTNPITGSAIAGLKENADDGISSSALAFYTSGDDTTLDEAMRINSNGSIMSAHASGATSNTAFGEDAGIALASGANYNTLFGHGAGQSITTADQNVLIGFQAGDAIVDGGHFNIAMGTNALGSLTSGDENIAIGDSAGVNMTGTSRCVLVGSGAGLDINADGAEGTVAIGYQAGANMTDPQDTGEVSTFVGYQSGAANTIGSANTALGYQALLTNVAGGRNTAIGFQSLKVSTAGSAADHFNTAVGYKSGLALTSGTHNVFIGGRAGLGTQLVDKTVIIGAEAGEGVMDADADGTIAIGYKAGTAITSGEHNTAIGFESLLVATDANGCTALGKSTLKSVNKSGNSLCTAVGFQAGTAVTDGVNNSMYGCDSGVALIGGDDNTLLGKGAGRTLTTGDDNTIIGSMADSEGTGTNRAVGIGRDVTAVQDYTTLGDGSDDIRAAHGTATWATVSDQRFKKDIETSTAGLSFIKDLRPVTYKWKSKGEIPDWSRAYEEGSEEQYKNSKHNHGFIAQEVKQAIDNHSEIKDGFSMWYELSGQGGQQEVGETALVPILVKAVQELSAKVKALEDA